MKKTLITGVFIFVALCAFSQSISIRPNELQLPRVSALPSCLAADYGEMVFLTTNNKAHVCNSTGWVAIETSTAGGLTLPINATSALSGSQLIYLSNTNGGANSIGMSGTTSAANGGIGVSGSATSSSPTNNTVGVYGANVSTVTSALRGIGVYGKHEGSGWGVYGQVTEGIGVEGVVGAPTTTTKSVIGTANTGNGVWGNVTGVGIAGNFTGLVGGIAGQFHATGTNSRAIYSVGAVRFSGIGEADGKFLESDLNGVATWQNITRNDVLFIPATSFFSSNSQHLLFTGALSSFQILSSGTEGTLLAPVLLPNGATITSFKLNYLDNSSSHAITSCILQTNSQTAFSAFTALSSLTIPTTTSSSLQSVTSPVLNLTVNNDTNFYRVLVTMNASPLIGIAGVEIKYTYQVNN